MSIDPPIRRRRSTRLPPSCASSQRGLRDLPTTICVALFCRATRTRASATSLSCVTTISAPSSRASARFCSRRRWASLSRGRGSSTLTAIQDAPWEAAIRRVQRTSCVEEGLGPTATSSRSPERQTVLRALAERSSRRRLSTCSATKRRASSRRAVRCVSLKKFSAAAENFFKDTHLTALRELALRFVAEQVDNRLRELRSASALKTVWRSGERLLVAVGPSPSSTQLVRWTRRMAASQGASWIAVSVEDTRPLDKDAQRRLEQNLALARELGAEIVVTHDSDVADALVRVALQNNATQIVVGKSLRPRWLDALRGGNLVDRL